MRILSLRILAPLLTIVVSVLFLASSSAYAAQAHSVRVGGPDLVGAGADGNYSLIAQVDAAGNVSGEWQDAFTQDPGFHISVTCLTVVGNQAWVGGVITQASNPAFIGVQARSLVTDGGLPNGGGDSISFTFIFPNGNAPDCTAQPAFAQIPLTMGQVTIK